MPKRFSPKAHARVILDLKLRDGDKCAICGQPGELEIDHKDGNPQNNTASNLRLAHRGCNVRAYRDMTRDALHAQHSVSVEREREANAAAVAAEGGGEGAAVMFQHRKSLQIRNSVKTFLEKNIGVVYENWTRVQQDAASYADCSLEAARKWLIKSTGKYDPYFISEQPVGLVIQRREGS